MLWSRGAGEEKGKKMGAEYLGTKNSAGDGGRSSKNANDDFEERGSRKLETT